MGGEGSPQAKILNLSEGQFLPDSHSAYTLEGGSTLGVVLMRSVSRGIDAPTESPPQRELLVSSYLSRIVLETTA